MADGTGRAIVRIPLSDAQRRDVLDDAVSKYVKHGYEVETNSGRRAVVSKRQQVNLLLNLGLVVITGGFWLLVLGIRLLNWPKDRVLLTVDDYGAIAAEFSS